MGQYYRFVSLNSHKKNYPNKDKVRATMCPWVFNQGAKIMEFSYIGNNWVGRIENLINIDNENGRLAGTNILFAGDYADEETDKYSGEKVNVYSLASESGLDITPETAPEPRHYRYLINKTKKVFFDMDKVKVFHTSTYEDGEVCKWQVHPLPLLCNDGCIGGEPRGGGDYSNKHREVGAWRRNVVVTSDNRPDENEYREVFYNFYEKW